MTKKDILAVLASALDGGATVETIKPSDIFICGPNSHNNIPGAYRASGNGKVCSYHEVAVRENRRGWIPRLRAALKAVGLHDVKVVVKYDPTSCWVRGVGPTASIMIEHGVFKDGNSPAFFSAYCLPVASSHAIGIQKTLPRGWVAEKTHWEKTS